MGVVELTVDSMDATVWERTGRQKLVLVHPVPMVNRTVTVVPESRVVVRRGDAHIQARFVTMVGHWTELKDGGGYCEYFPGQSDLVPDVDSSLDWILGDMGALPDAYKDSFSEGTLQLQISAADRTPTPAAASGGGAVQSPAATQSPPSAHTPPSAANRPTPLGPANAASMAQSTDVTLRWNSAANATQYKVELWGGPYERMTPCDWQSGTSCHIGQMWPGTMSWRVKARNASGQETDWSDTWSFTIQETPPTQTPVPSANRPTLSTPGNGSSMAQSTDVTLRWNSATNATQYKVELWGGPYERMTPCDWQSGTSCHIGQMWPGNMMWRVKARDASGRESDWSDEWNFTIMN
jgi:hypothetical protein